ncbi:DUF4192 family protein [Nesterenkonia salmonea]|uniref:DUF4192 family protein n=1 Tax=Nesterenkonia salmonea TaxID=1804987 RepID=A0A5R9BC13_9MICC|nr:DUF4192 family protein [Nesterenkonia salmonea]TLP96553.1 DUF4192 family protein [Nesterenkonia salmonea]
MSDSSKSHRPDQANAKKPSESSSAQRLSIDRPGDALALVQHTFGHLPKDSLVVIGLSPGATGGHLRVDLAPVLEQPERMGAQCAAWIAGPEAAPAPEAAMAVIFDSERPDPDSPDQYDVVMARLEQGLLEQAGAALIKIWRVGQGLIRDYECSDTGETTSFPGEDADSALKATLQRIPELARNRASSPAESLAQFLATPPLATEAQQSVVREHSAPPPSREEAVITLWDAALRRCMREAHDGSRTEAAWIHQAPEQASALLRTLEKPENVELLMAVTVSSLDTVGDTCDILGAESASGMRMELAWGLSSHPPQWERVESLSALLHHLLPYAVDLQRAEILGIRSWVEWLRGSASTATVFADAVRQQHPELWASRTAPPVAHRVLHCIRVLGVCPLARVKESSYSWWLGRR